ncbi:methyltransferase domain-containing protein [Roseomonas sp. GC11]|uniref:CheR family methyltransferase n=1 Tax=Roseomonas sp. GC11 TaxID=2950546 RepID=UPI002108BB75|nr:CheR family methyltransferase [Roseomonas sp. GC11]MCQ4161250.1 methyltransferase domain-containing protein [Roseomonas sp. GC11]
MTPDSFATFAALVRARSGMVLTPDKDYMLEGRLGPLLRREGLPGLDALAQRLRAAAPGAEALAREIAEALTINESSFFRDGKPFDHLRRLLPQLRAARPAGQRLRLWSAACSTGQEAYSIAMLLREQGLEGEILGTDLSREVLERAREGVFTQFEVQRGLPVQMLVRYFRQEGGKWRILPELRAMARFEEANLLEPQRGLGLFDVIFCRNVLIYFDPPTKEHVLALLARHLAPDGVLFLGGAETVLGLSSPWVPMAGERGAFVLSPQEAALAF